MLTRRPLLTLLFALLLPIAGHAQALLPSPAPKPEPLPVYDKWGGDFTLTDQNGLEVSLSDFKGKVILLTFGYTHCPDICPNTLFILRNVIKKLGDEADKAQVLFITLDPKRDYPERIKTFVEFFNPAFVGLTGSEEEISAVAQLYGMKFEKEFFEESEIGYGIAHASIIYLIDQAGRIRRFYKLSAPTRMIADDMLRLIHEGP